MVIEQVNVESSFNVEMNVRSGNMLLEGKLSILTSLCVQVCAGVHVDQNLTLGYLQLSNYFLS